MTRGMRGFMLMARRAPSLGSWCVAALINGAAWSDIIEVPGDAPDLAAAIAIATSGDVVHLAPGVHELGNRIDCSTPLTIVGTGSDPESVVLTNAGTFEPSLFNASLPPGAALSFEHLTLRGLVVLSMGGGTLQLNDVAIEADDAFGYIPSITALESVLLLTEIDVRGGDPTWFGAGGFVDATDSVLLCSDLSAEGLFGPLFDLQGSVGALLNAEIEGVTSDNGMTAHASVLYLDGCDFSGWTVLRAIHATWSDFFATGLTCSTLTGPLVTTSPPGGFATLIDSTFVDCGSFEGIAAAARFDADVICVRDCIFADSLPLDTGASALRLTGGGSIVSCVFLDNETGGYGAVRTAGTFDIIDSLFSGNRSGDGAGAVRADGGSLTLVRTSFLENQCNDSFYAGHADGGAVAAYDCAVAVDACLFQNNRCDAYDFTKFGNRGGALALSGGSLIGRDTIFQNNVCEASPVGDGGDGGAIELVDCTALLERCHFVDNFAGATGGALHAEMSSIEVIECAVVGNSATVAGGLFGAGSISDSTVCGNAPDNLGGPWAIDLSSAIDCGLVRVPLDVTTIQAGIDLVPAGGVVSVAAGTYFESIDLRGKPFLLLGEGGSDATTIDASGLAAPVCRAMSGEGPSTIVDGLRFVHGSGYALTENERVGGGLYCVDAAPQFLRCRFETNHADSGGAVYTQHADVRFEACAFRENTALQSGGALRLIGGAPSLLSCVVEDNSAGLNGGGVSWTFDRPRAGLTPCQIDFCILEHNTAPTGGGLYIESSNGPAALVGSRVCGNSVDQISGPFTDGGGNLVCSCVGDYDSDGMVGPSDLTALLAAWGPANPGDSANLDGDSDVDATDFAVLIAAWGPCPSLQAPVPASAPTPETDVRRATRAAPFVSETAPTARRVNGAASGW